MCFWFCLGNKQNSLASNQAIRVLFIGNSLTTFNDMPSIVKKMGSTAKEKISIETFMIARGGDSLECFNQEYAGPIQKEIIKLWIFNKLKIK